MSGSAIAQYMYLDSESNIETTHSRYIPVALENLAIVRIIVCYYGNIQEVSESW